MHKVSHCQRSCEIINSDKTKLLGRFACFGKPLIFFQIIVSILCYLEKWWNFINVEHALPIPMENLDTDGKYTVNIRPLNCVQRVLFMHVDIRAERLFCGRRFRANCTKLHFMLLIANLPVMVIFVSFCQFHQSFLWKWHIKLRIYYLGCKLALGNLVWIHFFTGFCVQIEQCIWDINHFSHFPHVETIVMVGYFQSYRLGIKM